MTYSSTCNARPARRLNLDLAAAGIEKEDERGRTVDLHALRHTLGTHLSKSGVAPRTARAAMRHSSLDLTMDVYTDSSLLDVAGAMEALPELSLEGAAEPPPATYGRAAGSPGATPQRGPGRLRHVEAGQAAFAVMRESLLAPS